MEDTLKDAIAPLLETGKSFVKNPKNQLSAGAAGAAYVLTKNPDEKLRNAVIAGVLAELFLPRTQTKGADPSGKK